MRPITSKGFSLIRAAQLRAARALPDIDQKPLADTAGIALPTVRRMETSEGTMRVNVDLLVKVMEALTRAGIELLNVGGRAVLLKEQPGND